MNVLTGLILPPGCTLYHSLLHNALIHVLRLQSRVLLIQPPIKTREKLYILDIINNHVKMWVLFFLFICLFVLLKIFVSTDDRIVYLIKVYNSV